MTRILVSSSSNPSRSSSLPGPSSCAEPQVSPIQVPRSARDDEASEEVHEQIGLEELLECNRSSENKAAESDDPLPENLHNDWNKISSDTVAVAEAEQMNAPANSNSRRFALGSSNPVRAGSSRRAVPWPTVSTRTSPAGLCPSPRSHCESEGYNSADEQNPCFVSSYNDAEFEIDIGRATGLEVKRMVEDGNCLFRAVADQVYGDSEAYDLIRQMCIEP
ncbi:hypothetical protein V6N13_039398 [Hibiscus sabdariffa]